MSQAIEYDYEDQFKEAVEKITILPPQSKIGTIDQITRNKIINNSILCGKYETEIDNETAYEKINTKYEEIEKEKKIEAEKKEIEKKKKEQEKIKKQEEKERKNSAGYKLGKKVTNKAVDKVINKGLNKLFKNLFK